MIALAIQHVPYNGEFRSQFLVTITAVLILVVLFLIAAMIHEWRQTRK